MKSKAIVFTGPRQVELVELEVKEPGPGELLLRTLVSQVSTGTELICFRGECDPDTHWAEFMAPPLYPGYSAVGEVVAVGDGVSGFAVGDRLSSVHKHQQYATVPADSICSHPLPEDITDEQAAWGPLAFITQTGVRHAEHVLGDTAVVIGLGPLGQLTVQYLRLMGLWEILAIDTDQWRLDVAIQHGATQGFLGDVGDAKQFVAKHTEGRLADVVYDVTGHYSVLPKALPLARDFGKVILLGDSPHPSRQQLTDDILNRQVKLLGTRSSWLPPQYACWTRVQQTELFLTYLRRGQMQVDDLVTHKIAPDDALELYPRLLADRSGTMGILYDWR